MLERVAETVKKMLPSALLNVSAADVAVERARFPLVDYGASPVADAGYVITDAVLEEVVRAGTCDFVVVTNGDNLYGADFVPAVRREFRAGFDLVATNFISRYSFDMDLFKVGVVGPYHAGPNAEFKPRFAVGQIDLGAAAVRVRVLRDTGVRFVVDRLAAQPDGKDISFAKCDGHFFERLASNHSIRSKIIERALFIRQGR